VHRILDLGHDDLVIALFFSLGTPTLLLVLALVAGLSIALGVRVGVWLRGRNPERHGSIGVIQGALFGLIGLLLAFGLSMAVGRYEHRRAAMVDEANAISTVILRAGLLAEPYRSQSLELLRPYTAASVQFSEVQPGSAEFRAIDSELSRLFTELWSVAAQAIEAQPVENAPRLYIEALGDADDAHGVRTAGLSNHVPTEVALLIVFASSAALMALGLHLALVGRGLISSVAATLVVVGVLFVSYDLDRPTRGLIMVPDTPLVTLRDKIANSG
jgi:hypothetical protein